MIDITLQRLSKEYDISYIEIHKYISGKSYKVFILDINGKKETFKSKYDLFLSIKGMI
jgi:hypothetical protein